MTDRITNFRRHLESLNESLFDEKVAEITEWIQANSITKEEVEALLDTLPEDYFYTQALQNIYDMDEDIFEEDEAEEDEE